MLRRYLPRTPSQRTAAALAVVCAGILAWEHAARQTPKEASAAPTAPAAQPIAGKAADRPVDAVSNFVNRLPSTAQVEPLFERLSQAAAVVGATVTAFQAGQTKAATATTLGQQALSLQIRAARYADLKSVLGQSLTAQPEVRLQRLVIRRSADDLGVEASVQLVLLFIPKPETKGTP